jgi:hypothetical protein
MKNRCFFISLIALGLFCASLAHAHHAVHGRYDYEAKITLTGKIVRVDWINPHVRIFLDVAEEDGSITAWEIVSGPAQFMRRCGISKSKLMNDGGEPVTFLGIRARNPDLKQIWAYRINYADGRFYDLSVKRPAR